MSVGSVAVRLKYGLYVVGHLSKLAFLLCLKSSVCSLLCRLLGLLVTVSGLAKVAIFTTNVDAENQTLINHKTVCGELNRHFCQTRVMPSFFFLGRYLSVHCRVVVRWLGSSFAVFCLALCVRKNCKCATKFVGFYFAFS
jgi:hypothetical protein